MRKIGILLLALILTLMLIPSVVVSAEGDFTDKNPEIQIEMENGGIIVLELYPEYAPKTVENFVKLVKQGFYDGLTFHRIVDGFMAQGGDPQSAGVSRRAESITGEFSSNGFKQNTLSHKKGVISMARANDPNSASSQFFIMLADGDFLDGDYAAFGRVTEGMEVLQAFEKLERTTNSMGEKAIPVVPLVMKKVTVISEPVIPEPESDSVTAVSSSQKVLVNGMEIPFDAYNIDGSNYFKLRDLAYVLSGTEKEFEVGYDETTKAITLTSGKAYTAIGGEMAAKVAGDKTATPTTSKIYLDGKEIAFTVYNIDGNNYFKLRDVGEAFDFGIDWDGEKNIITIDTIKGYSS